MRISKRQYVYIAVIIALAIFNGVRIYRARHAESVTRVIIARSPGTSPLWAIYDHAATLRDAPVGDFTPALAALTEGLQQANAESISPQTTKEELIDLQGCRTWLLFYRQAFLHPAVDKPGQREQTQGHVAGCVKNHRDDAL